MDYQSGKIYIANSESFDTANLSEPLTAYAAGYKVQAVEDLLNTITPEVRVPGKRFEFRVFGKGHFVSETDDARANGGDFKRVELKGAEVSAKLFNRGLSAFIDKDDYFDTAEQQAVEMLKGRLMLNELNRAFELLGKAAGAGTAKKWMASGAGRSSPDADIAMLAKSVGDECGLNANTVVIGQQAWLMRFAALLGSDAPGEGVGARMKPEELAALLGLDAFKVATARKETFSASGSKKNTLGDASAVYAFNSQQGITRNDPSSFKRFVLGEGMKVYVEPKATGRLVTVEHYSLMMQTGTGAAKALAISDTPDAEK